MHKKYHLFLILCIPGLLVLCGCTNHDKNCCCCAQQKNYVAGIQIATGDKRIINGRADLHDVAFDALTVNGVACLTNVIVHKSVLINGRASITKSTLSGIVTINGALQLSDSTIDQLRLSTTGTHTFERSKLESLIVTPGSPSKDVTIELVNTTVSGNIQFENARQATLVLKGSSSVKGTVSGAIVKDMTH